MHLKSKGLAYTGVWMALAVILIILSSLVESSSMFLLAAASFLTGVVQRRFRFRAAACFGMGTFVLGLILAPNKLYCFTYLAFSVYVILAEWFREKKKDQAEEKREKNGRRLSGMAGEWIAKGIVYHLLLAVSLIAVWKLVGPAGIVSEEWLGRLEKNRVLLIIPVMGAEILWLLFDRAYLFFQERYGKLFLQ